MHTGASACSFVTFTNSPGFAAPLISLCLLVYPSGAWNTVNQCPLQVPTGSHGDHESCQIVGKLDKLARFKLFMDGIKLKPIQLGVEVSNVHLADIHSLADIETLKQLVHEHRIAVFRNQPDITPEKQVEISKWFGELDSDAYYKHDKSPLRDIFRVSNDRKEGCTNVGRTGWHIDGTFRRKPYSISVYHMKSVPLNGDTRFIGLNEVLTSLQKEQFDRWNRIWMVTGDHHSRLFHPLVYPHPITGKLTMCFHLGMTDGFMQDYGSAEQRMLKASESVDLLREIHNEIVKNDEKLVYSHKWTEGDFILSDNLAVGHEASPETQRPISEVGLRILHRVTVAGKFEPKK